MQELVQPVFIELPTKNLNTYSTDQNYRLSILIRFPLDKLNQ